MQTDNSEHQNKLPILARYVRETLLEIKHLIADFELPYELELKLKTEHKNWKICSRQHIIDFELTDSDNQ